MSGVSRLGLLFQKKVASPAFAWRKRFLVLPDTANTWVVLKVLSHAGQMLHDWDSESLQFDLVAKTGLH